MFGYLYNTDFWRGERIWKSDYYKVGQIKPELEYTKLTHPALIAAGKTLKLSPERMRYVLEKIFTSGNVYSYIVGGGLRLLMEEATPADRERTMTEIVQQLPFIRKFTGRTSPSQKYREKIEEKQIEDLSQKKVMNERVNDLAERYYMAKEKGLPEASDIKNEFQQYLINEVPREDRKKYRKRFMKAKYFVNLPDKRWWLDLANMPPEIRAYAYNERMNKEDDPEKRSELEKNMKQVPGINSQKFKSELRKLVRSEKKVNEPN
jgi:hypothetical protein